MKCINDKKNQETTDMFNMINNLRKKKYIANTQFNLFS